MSPDVSWSSCWHELESAARTTIIADGAFMQSVSLAFFWHQHQPYYPNDLTGENEFPWVRLHGTKDY